MTQEPEKNHAVFSRTKYIRSTMYATIDSRSRDVGAGRAGWVEGKCPPNGPKL